VRKKKEGGGETGFSFLFFETETKKTKQEQLILFLLFFFLFSSFSFLKTHPPTTTTTNPPSPGVTQLYVVGGNGGNAAANAIHDECERAGVVCSVVGVPKSIDNDILLIDRCFGFDTAVEEAQRSLLAAKVEASSAHRGVGLVRLMGRQSG